MKKRRQPMKILLVSLLMIVMTGTTMAFEKLPTAEHVDIARYIGKWYAVESLPQFFTRKCIAQSAEYDILNESAISVHNICYKKNGKTSDISGKAVVKDPATNARLEVTFDSFFTKLFRVKGEYVIIKLSEGYDTVLIGSTDRKSLWIMSRTPSIDPDTLKEFKDFAGKLGFDTAKFISSKF
jgi:apolipoprotein D and lipocalin family protein